MSEGGLALIVPCRAQRVTHKFKWTEPRDPSPSSNPNTTAPRMIHFEVEVNGGYQVDRPRMEQYLATLPGEDMGVVEMTCLIHATLERQLEHLTEGIEVKEKPKVTLSGRDDGYQDAAYCGKRY